MSSVSTAVDLMVRHTVQEYIKTVTKKGFSDSDVKKIVATAENNIKAIQSGEKNSEKALALSHVNSNLFNSNGQTALIEAIRFGGLALVKNVLREPGVKVNMATSQLKQTPLMHAIFRNDIYLVKELLSQKGIDVDVKDAAGKTAFDYAKKSNNDEICKFLQEFKKNIFEPVSSKSEDQKDDDSGSDSFSDSDFSEESENAISVILKDTGKHP